MNVRIEELRVEQINAFGTAYIHDFESVSDFFPYDPFQHVDYVRRQDDLHNRSFDRKSLAKVIRHYVSKWTISNQMEQQLLKLEQDNSLVVIGGQQAGLLTGPLYTIHKAITIIVLAKQKEEQLQVPVIPVFWIAGEDHDFDEINHTFIPKAQGTQTEKIILHSQDQEKFSIAHRSLPIKELNEWLASFFESQPQTEFTSAIYEDLKKYIENSETYTDFFTGIMTHLFSQYGLLYIQSADESFRKLQGPIFKRIIVHYDDIHKKVQQTIQQVKKKGFSPQIQMGNNPALLFLYENGERLLLEKVDGVFQTKDGNHHYSEELLLELAEKEPWRFSNNVITRPFMQESLFPTLAFVGGPGEIAYWALLGQYFNDFGYKLPILAPRMSMTLIEKPIANIIQKRQLPFSAIFGSFSSFRQEWLKEHDPYDIEQSFTEVKVEMEKLYDPLLSKIETIQPGLKQLGEKNLSKILEQVQYLEKRSKKALEDQHEAALRQFDKVEQALYPDHMLQERVYNPFVFFNKHGYDLIDALCQAPLQINGLHKLVYLHQKDTE